MLYKTPYWIFIIGYIKPPTVVCLIRPIQSRKATVVPELAASLFNVYVLSSLNSA